MYNLCLYIYVNYLLFFIADTLGRRRAACRWSRTSHVTVCCALLFVRHSRSPTSCLSLESYVCQLLFGVSVPAPGRSARLPLLGEDVVLQRPTAAELPLFEYPIRQLFAAIGVEKVIQIVSCLLLEHQIVLYAHGERRGWREGRFTSDLGGAFFRIAQAGLTLLVQCEVLVVGSQFDVGDACFCVMSFMTVLGKLVMTRVDTKCEFLFFYGVMFV